jgi:hypothetical protein
MSTAEIVQKLSELEVIGDELNVNINVTRDMLMPYVEETTKNLLDLSNLLYGALPRFYSFVSILQNDEPKMLAVAQDAVTQINNFDHNFEFVVNETLPRLHYHADNFLFEVFMATLIVCLTVTLFVVALASCATCGYFAFRRYSKKTTLSFLDRGM